MRLHPQKLPELAHEILSALVKSQDIEVAEAREVELDLKSVLEQYLRTEQEITEKAQQVVAARGLPPNEIGRIKRAVAEERGFKLGDEAIDYLLDQLVEMLMHSTNVEEVWAEDVVLRKHMRDPLRRHASLDTELRADVRSQLKHVAEGTALWEVEYQRMMEEMRRRKGL